MRFRRLKKLKLSRVDLVPVGANPGARIELVKQETKSENGKEFRRGDYAYTPDGPSTWKLRLTNTPGGSPDAGIVGAAAAALGPGFRGQKVQIPANDLSGVKSKVLAAWVKANPDKDRSDAPAVLSAKEGSMSHPIEKTAEELQTELEKAQADLAEVRDKLAKTPAAELDTLKQKLADTEAELAEAKGEPDVQKQLADTKAELVDLKKAQRKRDFVVKAEKFKNIGSAERIGKLLDAADQYFEEAERELLDKILAGASEQIEKGALFERFSKDGDDVPATWEERLDTAAAERVSKSDGKLTIEQARVQIMHEDAALRKEYAESRAVS